MIATPFLRDDVPGQTAMHREEFISVAICSNGRFDFLDRVIDAVHQHADMAYEIVVSDDAGHRRGDRGLADFEPLRDRVSRLVINCGSNMGLAVNANLAIGATRGRNVVFLSDDSLVTRPFMREVWAALESAPYIGVMNLGDGYIPDDETGRDVGAHVAQNGFIRVRMPHGGRAVLHRRHGGSWANAFRKAYWYDVGGYDESDVYGDLPYINKGWARGYFSAVLAGPAIAYDLDMVETHGTRGTVGLADHHVLCHYPRLFGVPRDRLMAMGSDRNAQCAARNHNGRVIPFNDFDAHSWSAHMREVMASGRVDLDVLETMPVAGRDELRRDAEDA